MTRAARMAAIGAALSAMSSAVAQAPSDDGIGRTAIPFYTGNLSVGPFMTYWGTNGGGLNDLVGPDRIAVLRRIGVFADCDYQAWCLAEPERGRWDFGMYRANADALKDAGFGYIPFCWLHFPPRWYLADPAFVPYECVEHGKKLMQLSPWAPGVWDVYRRFYTEQRRALGDRVTWMRVGTPSDYGEIGYPAAMTSWLVPQEHAHPGWWCGDRYARADFRDQMRRRFRTLTSVRERWGVAWTRWDQVTYPDLTGETFASTARSSGKATDRRRWLDFIDWYNGVWLRFVPKLVGVIRESYPTTPMIASVGYSSELAVFGNDYSAQPKMARRIGIALQTPGAVSYYGVKRVSTACHHYGCAFYTEPPGDVPPHAEIGRFFMDISNGVQVYFEYPQNLDRARNELREYKEHMTGSQPKVDVAVFNPTVEHRLNGGAGNFPQGPYLLGEMGRDRFDYDVVDEALIVDGALSHYRVLAYVAGNVTEAASLRKIVAWVRAGGTLVTCRLGDVETVEGDRSVWRSLMPSGLAGEPAAAFRAGDHWQWEQLGATCVRRLGKGAVVCLPCTTEERALLVDGVARAAHDLSAIVAGAKNAPLIDGIADGVQATLFADRILYYNGTDRAIEKPLVLRPEDWTNGKRPREMTVKLALPPHSIRSIVLH